MGNTKFFKMMLVSVLCVLSSVVPLKSNAQAEEEDAWMDQGADYAEYEAYQYDYEDGMKSMVDRLPVYESMDVNSPVLTYIPYGKEFQFLQIEGDEAWLTAVYNGVTGCTLAAGCSYNGIDADKGKAWFEERLQREIKILSEDPDAFRKTEPCDPIVRKQKFTLPILAKVGLAVGALVIVLLAASRMSLKWRYFVQVFGCGACIVLIVNYVAEFLLLNYESLLLPFYIVVLVAWIWLGRLYFAKMAQYTEISNERIKLSLFATVIATIIFGFSPLLKLIWPDIIFDKLVAIVLSIPLWWIQSSTRNRCPKCHRLHAFYWDRKEASGTQTEVKRDLSKSKETLDQLRAVVVIDKTIRTTDTNVYQMWRHFHKCIYCGHEESKRLRGKLLSTHRVTETETETTRYPHL